MTASLIFGVATGPDLLRLLAVPVFAWAAYRDLRTRRVPNRLWLPLLSVGALALAWDAFAVLDGSAFRRRLFAVQVAFSLGFVAPLGYVFWRIGGFGGADAKAIITLAVVFPTAPAYSVSAGYPLYEAPLGVFSFTILSNAVLVGLVYPLALALRNLPAGDLTPAMFVGRPVAVEDLTTVHGRLLEMPEGFTRRGLDVDALRMYLRWRGVTFAALLADPDRFRETAPADPNDPGDGSIDDGDWPEAGFTPVNDDPWAAAAFLEEHAAYGTSPKQLRMGLTLLADSDRKHVWLTPGIPFIIPIFVGLLVALTFGDVMFAALAAL